MADETQIINIALTTLGADPINDPNQKTENAKFAQARFQTALEGVLTLHPWNCAICRQIVPAESATPAFGFSFSYPLPSTPFRCLRVWEVNGNSDGWKVESGKIVTDIPGPLQVKYIGCVSVDMIPPLVAEVVGMKLAAGIAYRITKSKTRTAEMRDEFKSVLREARSCDAQEGTPDPITGESTILAARR